MVTILNDEAETWSEEWLDLVNETPLTATYASSDPEIGIAALVIHKREPDPEVASVRALELAKKPMPKQIVVTIKRLD